VVAGSAAASYSTGGGGVVLEHQYGATLLATLLTGDPLPELGDDVTPIVARFQASAVSAVDDLLISGRTPDGGVRQVSVGVRRAPKLVKSETKSAEGEGKSVRLVASYLKVVTGARFNTNRRGRGAFLSVLRGRLAGAVSETLREQVERPAAAQPEELPGAGDVRREHDQHERRALRGVIGGMAADTINHGAGSPPVPGTEGIKRQAALLRTAIPNLRVTLNDRFGADDRVVSRWTGSGTHAR
jgi:hypothetical protein